MSIIINLVPIIALVFRYFGLVNLSCIQYIKLKSYCLSSKRKLQPLWSWYSKNIEPFFLSLHFSPSWRLNLNQGGWSKTGGRQLRGWRWESSKRHWSWNRWYWEWCSVDLMLTCWWWKTKCFLRKHRISVSIISSKELITVNYIQKLVIDINQPRWESLGPGRGRREWITVNTRGHTCSVLR